MQTRMARQTFRQSFIEGQEMRVHDALGVPGEGGGAVGFNDRHEIQTCLTKPGRKR